MNQRFMYLHLAYTLKICVFKNKLENNTLLNFLFRELSKVKYNFYFSG